MGCGQSPAKRKQKLEKEKDNQVKKGKELPDLGKEKKKVSKNKSGSKIISDQNKEEGIELNDTLLSKQIITKEDKNKLEEKKEDKNG